MADAPHASAPARRRVLTAVRTAAVAAALALAGGAGSAATAPAGAAAGQVTTVGPSTALTPILQNLRAGDTLRLLPGTYDVGYLRPYVVHPGTALSPVTITAADPARRPLLRGYVRLVNADHWHLDALRIQGTQADAPSLAMDGGRGWVVSRSEIFGAAQTGALANLAITSDFGTPSAFRVTGNCVHDAGAKHAGMDHNIYAAFVGSPTSGGVIERNLVYNHAQGAGIKLGKGGDGGTGPWNVTVRWNTIVGGGRQILLHGDVRGNRLYGNLLGRSTLRFAPGSPTQAVSAENVTGPGNTLSSTWTFDVGRAVFDNLGTLAVGRDVALRQDPLLRGTGTCTGWQPGLAEATGYGRWAPARTRTAVATVIGPRQRMLARAATAPRP